MKTTHQKGYAILFTVIVVTIISLIAFGISNSSYKQLILSAVAKDSQVAFYQADTATECALYADVVQDMFSVMNPPPKSFECGVQATTGKPYELGIDMINQGTDYNLTPLSQDSLPCFEIVVNKTTPSNPGDPIFTKLKGRGYNNCDKTNPRTVQREIEVNY
jgi:Tfp pilus assembly protein PilE